MAAIPVRPVNLYCWLYYYLKVLSFSYNIFGAGSVCVRAFVRTAHLLLDISSSFRVIIPQQDMSDEI